MRWTDHLARREKEVHTGFWWGDPRNRDHLEGPGVDRGYTCKIRSTTGHEGPTGN
jgi:hypothetical protein